MPSLNTLLPSIMEINISSMSHSDPGRTSVNTILTYQRLKQQVDLTLLHVSSLCNAYTWYQQLVRCHIPWVGWGIHSARVELEACKKKNRYPAMHFFWRTKKYLNKYSKFAQGSWDPFWRLWHSPSSPLECSSWILGSAQWAVFWTAHSHLACLPILLRWHQVLSVGRSRKEKQDYNLQFIPGGIKWMLVLNNKEKLLGINSWAESRLKDMLRTISITYSHNTSPRQ